MTSLTYFFTPIYSLKYIAPDTDIQGVTGDYIRIEMPYNDSNKNVIIMNIVDGDYNPKQHFFALNLMYLTKTLNNPNSSYSIILQGNRNDYNNDNLNQLLIIIPIMDSINNTISYNNINKKKKKKSSAFQSKIKKANEDLTGIINNITNDIYNAPKPIDPNNFLFNLNSGTLYTKKNSETIKRDIFVLDSSELYKKIIVPGDESDRKLAALNSSITLSANDYDSKVVKIKNNEQDVTLTTTTEPIYIDCNPVDDNSEPIDKYTSINPIQLNFSKINNIVIWFLSFLTFFIVLLIVYVIYMGFSMSPTSGSSANSVDAVNGNNISSITSRSRSGSITSRSINS